MRLKLWHEVVFEWNEPKGFVEQWFVEKERARAVRRATWWSTAIRIIIVAAVIAAFIVSLRHHPEKQPPSFIGLLIIISVFYLVGVGQSWANRLFGVQLFRGFVVYTREGVRKRLRFSKVVSFTLVPGPSPIGLDQGYSVLTLTEGNGQKVSFGVPMSVDIDALQAFLAEEITRDRISGGLA